jgi:hypothetical protein
MIYMQRISSDMSWSAAQGFPSFMLYDLHVNLYGSMIVRVRVLC